MKRQFLFRGKTFKNQWVTGDLIQYPSSTEIGRLNFADEISFVKVKKETVGQFIGTTDCDKTDIFEDDILQDDHGKKFIVRWSDGHCGFVAKPIEPDKVWPNLNPGTTRDLKVIGNIHDNPDLLN